jgi:hypothetical protein
MNACLLYQHPLRIVEVAPVGRDPARHLRRHQQQSQRRAEIAPARPGGGIAALALTTLLWKIDSGG